MKLKDSKQCQCCYSPAGPRSRADWITWHFSGPPVMLSCGCCTGFLCPACARVTMEYGPVFCKRKHQWDRQLIYSDMGFKNHVPVKRPGLRRRVP